MAAASGCLGENEKNEQIKCEWNDGASICRQGRLAMAFLNFRKQTTKDDQKSTNRIPKQPRFVTSEKKRDKDRWVVNSFFLLFENILHFNLVLLTSTLFSRLDISSVTIISMGD